MYLSCRHLDANMCRHRGIGMNKPKKKAVTITGQLQVRVLLRGCVLDPPPAADLEQDQPAGTGLLRSPRKLVVLQAEKEARKQAQKASRARQVFAKTEERFQCEARIFSARLRMLTNAKPQTCLGIDQKIQMSIDEWQNHCGWLQTKLKLEHARVRLLLAELYAEKHNSIAKDVANRRLKLLLSKS